MLTFEEFQTQAQAFFSLTDDAEPVKAYDKSTGQEVLYEVQQNFSAIQYLGEKDWRFHGNGAIGAGNTLLEAFANYSVLEHEWFKKHRQEQLAREL